MHRIGPLALLLAANVFMTVAWYGHLKYPNRPLWLTIVTAWLIALPEYCLQVPANRWGHAAWSAAQLKVWQEVFSLAVFAVFSVQYLGEPLNTNHFVAGLLLLAAVVVVMVQPF